MQGHFAHILQSCDIVHFSWDIYKILYQVVH